MKIYNEWMTDNEYFGEDYPNNKLVDDAKYRFEIQKQSNEGKDALVDGVSERIVAQNHTNPLNQVKYDKKLSFDITSNVHTGSLIEFDDKKWLVTSMIFDKQAYKVASVQECNNTLRFYNKTGILFTVPCIFTDISIDLSEGRLMNLPIGHYNVIIPSGYIDKNTENLNRRYILNGCAYKTEGISNATNGLTKIELVDDAISPNDNVEIGCADYYNNLPVYSIQILNGADIIIDGTQSSTLQLNIQCKLNDIIVENPVVTYTSSSTDCCTVSSSGLITIIGTGTSTITATYGTSSDTINVVVILSDVDNYQISISPADTQMYINRTKTFTANVTNNGVADLFNAVTWLVTNVDGSSNEYCTYVVDGRSLSITTKSQINKQIKIKASLNSDSAVYDERIIITKSLI
jgi:hypothetical protein